MITVCAGTDVYGAIRSVSRTPIVTQFAMFQMLPIFPLESYYLGQLGRTKTSGVPFLGGVTERAIAGIPCNRVNRLSVFIAYIRAIGAALILVGAIGSFMFIVGSLCDGKISQKATISIIIIGSILGSGLLISLPTYFFTYMVPTRDRLIRQSCARILGIAADPANVKLETANEIAAMTDEAFSTEQIPDLDAVLRHSSDRSTRQLDIWLVRTRVQVRLSDKLDIHENTTDQILHALSSIEGQLNHLS